MIASVALFVVGALALALVAMGLRADGVARMLIAGLVQTAVALAIFDLRLRLIPDMYSVAIAGVGLAGPLSPGLATSALGALLGGGMLAGVRWAMGRRLGAEAMGLGDVKLAAALGALLGPLPLLWSVFGAATLAALVSLVFWRGRGAQAPLGAFLAPVGVVVLCVQLA